MCCLFIDCNIHAEIVHRPIIFHALLSRQRQHEWIASSDERAAWVRVCVTRARSRGPDENILSPSMGRAHTTCLPEQATSSHHHRVRCA